ncbi:MAG: hypothetical protein ACRCSF_08055 [Mycobacteriaceae bacterium]
MGKNGLVARFDGWRKRTLVDLAHEVLGMASEPAREHWLGKLSGVSLEMCTMQLRLLRECQTPRVGSF